MLTFLFGNRKHDKVPAELYGIVVAQARQPHLFSEFAIPDTVMGRFDMLSLHTYLLCRRLSKQSDQDARILSQKVFDCFVDDVDRALRELGVGDTTVPKRKKRMVRSFYGQIDDFDNPLDSDNSEVLTQKVAERFGFEADSATAKNFADYMAHADKLLSKQTFDELAAGNLAWPEEKG